MSSNEEKTETIVKKFTRPDGTTVIQTTTIRRTMVPKDEKNKTNGTETPNNLTNKLKTMTIKDTKDAKKSLASNDVKVLEKKILKDHNEYRAKHGVPPLEYSKELSNFAQEWANKLAQMNTMQHRPNNKYGENLFCGLNIDPTESTKMWYNEIEFYTYFEKEPPRNTFLKYGHFTQLVWKDTKRIGFGFAYAADNMIYVVANYDPPGNMIGSFATNVLSLK